MAKETNRLLGHTDEADGIDEYDNPLPDWWVGLMWFTIVWALGYAVHYHFIADRSAVNALAAEMAAAEERWPTSAVASQLVLTDDAIAEGAQIYQVNCVACHGADMQGPIGPSLLDAEWLHGGAPLEIRATIAEGVLTKGMPNWESLLGPEAVNKVAAYVISQNAQALGVPLPDLDAEQTEASDASPGADPGSAGPS